MSTNFKGTYVASGCITDPTLTRAFWDYNPEAKDSLVDNLNWPALGTLAGIPDYIRLEKGSSTDEQGYMYSYYTIYPDAFDNNEGIVKFFVHENADGDLSICQCFWSTENLKPSDMAKLSVQVENFSILYGDYADYGGEIMPNINDVPLSWLPDVPIVQEILKSYDIPAPGLHKEPMASGENWILMSPAILTNEDRACLEALGMFEPENNKDICQRYWQWAKDKSDAILKRFTKIPD